MKNVLGFRCVLCGAEYGIDALEYVCPKHGNDGILDVVYDYDYIRPRLSKTVLKSNRDYSIWRIRAGFPVCRP